VCAQAESLRNDHAGTRLKRDFRGVDVVPKGDDAELLAVWTDGFGEWEREGFWEADRHVKAC
jgi:uncharacterized protein with beta-barrel porin domain